MVSPPPSPPRTPGGAPPPYENWERELQHLDIALDPVQRALLSVHAADLQRMKHQESPRDQASIQISRRSNIYAFFRSVYLTVSGIVFVLFSNPSAPFTDPIGFAYAAISYSVIFLALVVAQIVLWTVQITRLHLLFRHISIKYGGGFSVVNWSSPGMFDTPGIFDRAKKVLSTGSPDHCHVVAHRDNANQFTEEETSHRLGGIKTKFFDMDLARAFLLFSAIMYERDEEWVRRAADYTVISEKLLIRSELAIYKKAKDWDVRFTTISDFVTVSGAYVGAFYSAKGADGDPWITVVFKGTSPATFSEWITDVTFTHESAQDFLWGYAHQGFYTTLFPATGATIPVLPYRRILDALGAIGRQLGEETSGKRVNLFVTGHSLGAALASLFYSALLDSPPERGDNLQLRDGYCFGTPSVGDGIFVSGFEKLMHAHENRDKNFWRIKNARDVVADVPPGLAGPRPNRIALNPRSLLNYGPIGVEIHLAPKANGAPYYHFHPHTFQPGTEVIVVEDPEGRKGEYPAALFEPITRGWKDPIVVLTKIGDVFFPWLADHAPTSYWASLVKIAGNPRPAPDDPNFQVDPSDDASSDVRSKVGAVLSKAAGKRKSG